MDPIILGAIIAAVSGLISPIVLHLIIFLFENRDIKRYPTKIKQDLCGIYHGIILQDTNKDGNPMEFPITGEFKSKSKYFTGKAEFMALDEHIEMKFKTYYFDNNDNITIEYKNIKKPNSHKGLMLCHIIRKDDYRENAIYIIIGRLLGFAFNRNHFITGKVILKRGGLSEEDKNLLKDKKYAAYIG